MPPLGQVGWNAKEEDDDDDDVDEEEEKEEKEEEVDIWIDMRAKPASFFYVDDFRIGRKNREENM